MPEAYAHKRKPYPLSNLVGRDFVRVSCSYCKRAHNYRPEDLIQIFGDVDVDSLMRRMICESGREHGRLDVSSFSPSGQAAVGLKIRRLVRLEIKRVPVWREE